MFLENHEPTETALVNSQNTGTSVSFIDQSVALKPIDLYLFLYTHIHTVVLLKSVTRLKTPNCRMICR